MKNFLFLTVLFFTASSLCADSGYPTTKNIIESSDTGDTFCSYRRQEKLNPMFSARSDVDSPENTTLRILINQIHHETDPLKICVLKANLETTILVRQDTIKYLIEEAEDSLSHRDLYNISESNSIDIYSELSDLYNDYTKLEVLKKNTI